jgi:hypothetical protein
MHFDIERDGNLIEAGFWMLVSFVVLFKGLKSSGPVRRIYLMLAPAFFVFGISDIIESRTGAWWRPFWLLLLKGACVLIFALEFRAYYRLPKEQRTK